MPTTALQIAVPKETASGERRVALVPDMVSRLGKAGHVVTVERGAGAQAAIADASFEAAGARLAEGAAVLAGAQVVLRVRPMSAAEAAAVPEGATVISFFQAQRDAEALAALKARGVAVLSMDNVPRITMAQSMDALSSQASVAGYESALIAAAHSVRFMPMLVTAAGTLPPATVLVLSMDNVPRITMAQSMDALSSQASVAGYESALIAAAHSVRFMPMLVTAAGTLPPATVLVLGAGVAGLMAIATARRLGANVRAYDVRPEVKQEVESLGAVFVAAEAVSADARADQGYAKAVGEDMKQRQEAALAKHVAEADVVITTAQLRFGRAPELISQAMVETMKAGSVIVDLAAESGGNCAVTRPGETIVHRGVTVVGPLDVPSRLPLHASQMYARNLLNVVTHITKSGALSLDPSDAIVKAMRL